MEWSGSAAVLLLFAAVAITFLTPAQCQISIGFEKEKSQTSIGFEKANYAYNELTSSFELNVINLVKTGPANNASFLIGIQVEYESAERDVDLSFSQLASPLAMDSDKNETSLFFYIYDDEKAEFNESILLISSVAPGSPSDFECKKEDGCYQSTRITIVDNDGKLAYIIAKYLKYRIMLATLQ